MIPLHILLALAAEPLAIEPHKLQEIMAFLLSRAEGIRASAQEIEAKVSGKRSSEVAAAPGHVAVLPIFGMIMPRVASMNASETGTPLAETMTTFRGLLADDRVKAIIGQFHTPGGLADGVEEAAQEIFEARGIKPMVAQIDSQAHSAGFWLASAFDEIVASPSASGGSIGVYTVHDDVTGALEKLGVSRTLIRDKVAKHKGSGHPGTGPLSGDALANVQERVDHMAQMFRRSVARGLGVTQTEVADNFGQGLSFSADELVKRGMAHKVAPMSETLRRFGVEVSPARASATVDMRRSLANGERVSANQFERHLREVGFSNAAAKVVAVNGLRGLLDRRDVDETRNAADHPEATGPAASDVREFTESLAAFKLPSF